MEKYILHLFDLVCLCILHFGEETSMSRSDKGI